MSFKAFMHTQRDDVPPDSIPRMYDQYTMTYLADFSNNFFSASKTEEWFQDRYNPLNIHRLEKEAIDWALHEAAVIKESIQSHPLATVAAMSLEPLSVLQERQNEAKADVKDTDTEPPGAMNMPIFVHTYIHTYSYSQTNFSTATSADNGQAL